jgi:hypothetical protein
MQATKNEYGLLLRKPDEKWPLGKSRRKWKDRLLMNLRIIGCEDERWKTLTQVRVRPSWWEGRGYS